MNFAASVGGSVPHLKPLVDALNTSMVEPVHACFSIAPGMGVSTLLQAAMTWRYEHDAEANILLATSFLRPRLEPAMARRVFTQRWGGAIYGRSFDLLLFDAMPIGAIEWTLHAALVRANQRSSVIVAGPRFGALDIFDSLPAEWPRVNIPAVDANGNPTCPWQSREHLERVRLEVGESIWRTKWMGDVSGPDG